MLLPDGFSSRMASPSPPLKVPVTWQELVDDSDRVDYSLEETKKEFSETTRKQVNRRGEAFCREAQTFVTHPLSQPPMRINSQATS